MTDFEYREAKVQDWLNELETKYSKDYSTKLEEKLKKIKDIKDLENIDIDVDISEDLINFNILGKYLAVMELKTDFKKEFAENDDVFSMPFKKAIEEMKKRKPILFKDLEKMEKQEKENHFWIKKTTNLNITKNIYTKLIKSLEQGNTSVTFIKDVVSDYKLPKGYLEGVYRTVTTQAQQRGHLEQQLNMIYLGYKYGMFTSVLDGRETHKCHNMNGKILPIKEFIEKGLYPPLHYRCRSSIIQLDDDDLKDMNLKVTENIEENPNRFSDYRGRKTNYSELYEAKKIDVKILKEQIEGQFRSINIDKEKATSSVREKRLIEIMPIKNSKTPLWIEEETFNNYDGNVKEMLKFIDTTLNESIRLLRLSKKDLGNLRAVIMNHTSQIASYVVKGEIMYINPMVLGSPEKYDNHLRNNKGMSKIAHYKDIRSNYIHELAHFLEGKRFWNDKEGRNRLYQNIKELLKNKDIGKEISQYANQEFRAKQLIGEIIAESIVRNVLERQNKNLLVSKMIKLLKGAKIL